MDILAYRATMLGTTGEQPSFSLPPHYMGVEGNGSVFVDSHIVGGLWALGFLQYTAPLVWSK